MAPHSIAILCMMNLRVNGQRLLNLAESNHRCDVFAVVRKRTMAQPRRKGTVIRN